MYFSEDIFEAQQLESNMYWRKDMSSFVQAAQMAHAAARSNGATQMSGFELARTRVLKCENDLSAAREVMRVAARQADVSGDYLFEFTGFIPRSTGSVGPSKHLRGVGNSASGKSFTPSHSREIPRSRRGAIRCFASAVLPDLLTM
jgi:hypothetical protein